MNDWNRLADAVAEGIDRDSDGTGCDYPVI